MFGVFCLYFHNFKWQCHTASSLLFRVFCHVSCGLYFTGRIGIRSLNWSAKITHCMRKLCARCVAVSWKPSVVLQSPLEPVLSMIIRFIVLTPISTLQLLCGFATDEIR